MFLRHASCTRSPGMKRILMRMLALVVVAWPLAGEFAEEAAEAPAANAPAADAANAPEAEAPEAEIPAPPSRPP